MSRSEERGGRRRWLDEPRNVDRIVYAVYGVCALLFSIDFLDLAGILYHKHPHFPVEKLPGFYGLYGFFGSVGLVLVAKWMRKGTWPWKGLMRDEDYYDE